MLNGIMFGDVNANKHEKYLKDDPSKITRGDAFYWNVVQGKNKNFIITDSADYMNEKQLVPVSPYIYKIQDV